VGWSLASAVLVAVAVSVAGTFLVRSAAHRLQWLDSPNRRKMHSDPIPLMGGVAMYLAFVIALPVARSRTVFDEGSVVLVGATLLLIVGAIDDRRGLRPLVKLLAQVAAALLLVIGGVGVKFLPFDWLNGLITILWVVGICNAINLLDNMDGLSAGVAAIACFFFAMLSVMQGQIWVSIVSAVLMGAIVGFLYFNWNPATIFMGDAGSLLLGFLLAVLGIKLRFPDADERRTWLIPILVLAVPVLDTTLVTVSRLRRGVPVASGGRDHISHRLVRSGLTVRQAVTLIYGAALLSGGVAIAIVLLPTLASAYALAALLALAGITVLALLERVDLSDTGQTRRHRSAFSTFPLKASNADLQSRLALNTPLGVKGRRGDVAGS
jgi:UDP-GlcNAc:undecaprenyl-phosphate GlcNAc-1-phosphate transferase